MSSRLAMLGVLAGCSFSAPVGAGDDDGGIDPRGSDACVTFSEQTDTCLLQPGGPLELSGDLELDTDSGVLVDRTSGATIAITHVPLPTLGAPVGAIVASSIRILPGTRLRALGANGLALIATTTISLGDGTVIDVSAGGAGAPATCTGGPTAGAADAGGAGGGGGAGFGSAGGHGGDGNSDNIFSSGDGGNRSNALAAAPAGPRGGCPGARGGNGDDPGGQGGRAGGAVWLAAGKEITLAAGAGINAGGGGGLGGGQSGDKDGDAGGGGGGSGGMIWIEAPHVRSTGTLAANGGGGGEGSGADQAGAAGLQGTLGLDRASGGTGMSASGSAGGDGGHAAVLAGQAGAPAEPGGGGGGGGGVGFIRVLSPDRALATVSPPAP